MRRKTLIIGSITAALIVTGGAAYGATFANTSSNPAPPPARIGCDQPPNRTVAWAYENVSSFYASTPSAKTANQVCAAHGGGFAVSLSNGTIQGPAGPAGKDGKDGTNGTNGTNGINSVTSAVTTDLGGISSVPTGGSFVANVTLAGTVSLKAGTYEISVNAKATPNNLGTAQVFPQLFVYNQPANGDFTGDLFNIGSGALEPTATNHDSYYSGTDLVTLASDTTLDIYVFGYDSDSGAGSYILDDLTVTTVGLNTGS